jgi:hypothetical protein
MLTTFAFVSVCLVEADHNGGTVWSFFATKVFGA